MPKGNSKEVGPIRNLIYGPAKARKTWWALTAAKYNYNVHLIDSDNGHHIIRQIPEQYRHRVNIIETQDSFDRSIAAEFMVKLSKGMPFYWSETRKQILNFSTQKKFVEPEPIWYLDPEKFTTNDVLVIDSYTALALSVTFAYTKENGIDWADAEKTDWDGYAWANRLLDELLKRFKAFPCHVVVIGHQHQYEKFEGNKQNRKLVSTRLQLKSASGPHGGTIPKNFSDVLYFNIVGTKTVIDASPASDRDGGSRFLPPGKYNFEDLDFGEFMKKSGYTLPGPDNPESEGAILLESFEEFKAFPEKLKAKAAAEKELFKELSETEQETKPQTIGEPTSNAPAKVSLLGKGK